MFTNILGDSCHSYNTPSDSHLKNKCMYINRTLTGHYGERNLKCLLLNTVYMMPTIKTCHEVDVANITAKFYIRNHQITDRRRRSSAKVA